MISNAAFFSIFRNCKIDIKLEGFNQIRYGIININKNKI